MTLLPDTYSCPLHVSCNDVFMLMKNIHIRSQDKQIIRGVADFGGYTSTDGPA
jgi:hypothetical protein